MNRALLVLWIGVVACDDEIAASVLGARLTADPRLSPSPFNRFSCATCHAITTEVRTQTAPIDSGANLVNVVHRPSWWGGAETRLLDAVNVCVVQFMQGAPLRPNDDQARALYEYLVTISPDPSPPAIPLTVVKDVTALTEYAADADSRRGADLYARACRGCHGTPHDGAGRIGPEASIVPEDSLEGTICSPKSGPSPTDARACARAVVIEKVRHGKFFNIGGTMPLFALETLNDAQLADLVAYLGL